MAAPIAYTDKGTGTGAHDLQNDTDNLIDGVRERADVDGHRANFRVGISDAERAVFSAAPVGRFAFKHAHTEQNPETDWDVNVLLRGGVPGQAPAKAERVTYVADTLTVPE